MPSASTKGSEGGPLVLVGKQQDPGIECLVTFEARARSHGVLVICDRGPVPEEMGVTFFIRSYATMELGRWQRRCDGLTRIQLRICFPRLETINVGGETYQLPLRSVQPKRAPNQEELEYLVGFFDGDGCVTMEKTGQVRLAVSQNVDSADVLIHFRSLLGGGVGFLAAATGTSKAALRWQVTGFKMTEAATALSAIPSMKQAQLLIAAKGNVAQADRLLVDKDLKMLKQKEHVPHHPPECSWPYFAGFFDAEGTIGVSPTSVRLRLEVGQVNPCVLVHLLQLLHGSGLCAWTLYDRGSHSCLVCQDLRHCKQILELLFENACS